MSVFYDEWIRSLREQYKYVIRANDKRTEESLTQVLHSVGFRDEELRQLKLEATMHVDDVADDFMPDMDILQAPEPTIQAHPADCTCPDCVPIDEVGHDEDGQPLAEIEEEGEAGQVFPVAQIEPDDDEIIDELEDSIIEEVLEDVADEPDEEDPDAPQQLSMF